MAHASDIAVKTGPVSLPGAQAIRRAMNVARTVAQLQNSGASLARVAKATCLSRSTAFRILRSLVDEGLLAFDEVALNYRLGPLAHELGLAYKPSVRGTLPGVWQPAVEALARTTRLTSYLMKRSGTEAVCLLCVQGAAVVRAIPMETGQRVPLGIGAGSLAILSSLDDAEIASILESHGNRFAQFPAGSLTSATILERVKETRERGYSQTSGTVASGVSGIGVLVASDDPSGQLAMTVSAVAEDISPAEARKLAHQIRKAAAQHQ